MVRYYCSGFDVGNAFGHGLGEMFKTELKDTKNVVYIPGSPVKMEKARAKYVPAFVEHFKKAGIVFDNVNIISPELSSDKAKEMIRKADFVMLMGGDPFKQKEMCEKLGIMDELKKFNGLMLGFSAGAMLMSKYIIIIPCSEEYPNFQIEEGLNLDGISIYPHNNTAEEKYPDVLVAGDETYRKEDLLKVAKKYGKFYLLQDYDNKDISIIKFTDGKMEFYTENNGKIWEADSDVNLIVNEKQEERIK